MRAMTIVFAAAGLSALSASAGLAQNGTDITGRVQQMNKVGDDLQRERDRQRDRENLRRNDNANGVSQRTGPTGGTTSDGRGVWIGGQWSTK